MKNVPIQKQIQLFFIYIYFLESLDFCLAVYYELIQNCILNNTVFIKFKKNVVIKCEV